MEIDNDYLRTRTAIGFRASRELCSNYLFLNRADSRLVYNNAVRANLNFHNHQNDCGSLKHHRTIHMQL